MWPLPSMVMALLSLLVVVGDEVVVTASVIPVSESNVTVQLRCSVSPSRRGTEWMGD